MDNEDCTLPQSASRAPPVFIHRCLQSSFRKNLLPRKLVYINQLYQHALDRRLKALPKTSVLLLFMEMNILASDPFSIVKT